MRKLVGLIAIVFFISPTIIARPKRIKQRAKPDLPQELTSQEQFQQWTKLFAEVFDIMNKKYYLPAIPQDAMIKALDAFVSCDPHSSLLSGKGFSDILETTEGEIPGGVGFIITPKEKKDDLITIVEVIYDGPADKAGVKAQDVLLAINDDLIQSMTMDEVAGKLKGERGTQVILTVLRADQIKEFILVRDTIKDEQLHAFFFPETDTCYILLKAFNEQIYFDLKKVLHKQSSSKTKSIIIDLRNNSGGLLSSALDCVSLFVPKNSLIVSTKDKSDHILETFKTTREPLNSFKIPVGILVNNLTASAGEIFAGTLRLYSQNKHLGKNITPPVFIMGTQTFGKGSVQELIPLTDFAHTHTLGSSALRLTTSLYCLADGSLIQAQGITPDFIMEPQITAPESIHMFIEKFGREKSLKNSLKGGDSLFRQEIKKFCEPKNSTMRRKESIECDPIIHQSIGVLSFFNLAKQCSLDTVKTPKLAVAFMKKNLALEKVLLAQPIEC